MTSSICGRIVSSRRGLLAFIWSIVTLLTALAFVTALLFTMSARRVNYNDGDNNNNNNNNNGEGEEEEQQEDDEDRDVEVAVTSRAMAFAALWTAVLAGIMAIFGTVILGLQSPTGQYYTCCSGNVHRTTPLSLGTFIGALLMFANLTLVCSVLFGEFEIRDYSSEEDRREGEQEQAEEQAVDRSSMAFSIMCMFLTIMYAGFAAMVFAFSNSILEEIAEDVREEALRPSEPEKPPGVTFHPSGAGSGYHIGERFDVTRGAGSPSGGFVAPHESDSNSMA